MNDSELDEMLNQWGVPAAGAELRERVSAGFVAAPKRRRYFPSIGWKGVFAGFAAAGIVFLVVTAEAFPSVLGTRSPALRPPYVAMSIMKLENNGELRPFETIMSYDYKGTEMVMQRSQPGNPWMGAIYAFHIGVHTLMLQFAPNLVMPESAARDAAFSAYVKSGCANEHGVVIGHEKILGLETTINQYTRTGWRATEWNAPDLGCFALRIKNEDAVAGGGYRLKWQRDTMRLLGRRPDGGGWQ